ncbi:N-acetyltransferase ESCO2-like [Limanda limanda]|uniref:N-acetyltransferase ESCO2-like n=1 Tax=Limanda limanda TaxID=27771 RepID=UPI0029C80DCC|nr:N-acetyltransferase ESCO2-like [Limanda limanda]
MPDDPKYAVRKAEDVRRVADSELGFQQVTLSRPTQARTYLFINSERMVVGCLIAEPIRQAFRVLEQPDQQKDMTKDDFMERHRAWCCSSVPEQAMCGISRIWVFSLARRQGVATRMLDTVSSRKDSMEDSFDEDAYYERLGTRPALDAEALGGSYRRMVELFYLCTEEDPKKRPSAAQVVQALESNAPLKQTQSEVIVID